MTLARPLGFVVPEAILPDLKVKTKEDAIRALMGSLAAALQLSPEQSEAAIRPLSPRSSAPQASGHGLFRTAPCRS